MKSEIYLHIAKPCHENWDAMTPVAKGKFCSSCSKDVVDFSLMSDTEMLNFFKKPASNTCGRFYSDQLQRPLQEVKVEKKKGWQWLLASFTSLLFVSRGLAQKSTQLMGKVAVEKPKVTECEIIKGDTVMISGDVKLQAKPVKTIKPVIKKNTKGFVIPTIIEEKGEVSVIEMPKELLVNITAPDKIEKPPIVFSAKQFDTQCISVTMGLIAVSPVSPKKPEVIITKAWARKIWDTVAIISNTLTIYPNPAVRNSTVRMLVKEPGSYQFQLLDNNSRLLLVQENIATVKQQAFQMNLPANLTTGIYYMRMVNMRTKKVSTGKLIVQ